jgi:hypothetical protein
MRIEGMALKTKIISAYVAAAINMARIAASRHKWHGVTKMWRNGNRQREENNGQRKPWRKRNVNK